MARGGLKMPARSQNQFILAPKRIEAGHRGRASVAASRSGKAGMLILENPLLIRITKAQNKITII